MQTLIRYCILQCPVCKYTFCSALPVVADAEEEKNSKTLIVSGQNFQQMKYWHIFFSNFPRKYVLTFYCLYSACLHFHWRQFAWNFKTCFLGEKKKEKKSKKYHQHVICWISPESGNRWDFYFLLNLVFNKYNYLKVQKKKIRHNYN